MCLRRAPEKYIAGAALDTADLDDVYKYTWSSAYDRAVYRVILRSSSHRKLCTEQQLRILFSFFGWGGTESTWYGLYMLYSTSLG
jgi:hypothetical protein